jgi:hypothetical protein
MLFVPKSCSQRTTWQRSTICNKRQSYHPLELWQHGRKVVRLDAMPRLSGSQVH